VWLHRGATGSPRRMALIAATKEYRLAFKLLLSSLQSSNIPKAGEPSCLIGWSS